MTDVLIKWPCEDRHTGRTPYDKEGKDWSYAAACQGMPTTAG